MIIRLCDLNDEVVMAWIGEARQQAGQLEAVGVKLEVKGGSIFEHASDAIVSPANSFGFMDGGIDLAYSQRFGWHVQEALQREIVRHFGGELLIGQALSVKTRNREFPRLIAAPTMRVPMTILNPNDIRLATRAAVKLARSLRLKSIIMPGMGTATGNMKGNWAASLMFAGIIDAMAPQPFPVNLENASADHYRPYLDGRD